MTKNKTLARIENMKIERQKENNARRNNVKSTYKLNFKKKKKNTNLAA
jgi:hypothetical protein